MLILRGKKKPNILKMLTLVQDSNANAKEILDLVLWLEFKLVTYSFLLSHFQYFLCHH